MFDLCGKTAIVTGASSGLGRHFATLLSRQGADVALAARRLDSLEALRDEIIGSGGKAQALRMDVADPASISAAIASLPGAADILVNNAGLSGASMAADMPVEEWDSVFDVNLRGAFLTAQRFASRLRDEKRPGAIANVASILGLRVAGGVAAYTASKAGLVQLTKALALEWARHDIRVNALCPGYIETDINKTFFGSDAGKALVKRIPQRRLGRASELDAALLLMVSDEGSYITGSSLAVDGGHLVSTL